jgi:hypothetical protein
MSPQPQADAQSSTTSGPSNAKAKCFRISDVPEAWSKEDLRRALETLDPAIRSRESELALYPACHGSGQVAIFNLKQSTEYFKRIVPYKPFAAFVQGEHLSIDCDFEGLTPLNTPPRDAHAE